MIKEKKLARTANKTTSITMMAEFAAMTALPDAPLMHIGQDNSSDTVFMTGDYAGYWIIERDFFRKLTP